MKISQESSCTYEDIAAAIIERAATDYLNSLRAVYYGDVLASYGKYECEKFFESEWFTALSGIDGKRFAGMLGSKFAADLRKCEEKLPKYRNFNFREKEGGSRWQ